MRLIALLLATSLIEFTYAAYAHASIHTLPAAKARALPIRAVATNPIYDVEPERLEEPHQEAIERLDRSDIGSMQGVVVPTALPKPGPAATKLGFWKRLQNQQSQAVTLLKRFGGTYILCSLAVSVCSMSFFYTLVANGLDAPAVLASVGLTLPTKYAGAGTIGLAYVLHKASSPIRFPPTVALTAVVGRRLERWRTGRRAEATA